jgi:hypothetical protein
MSVSWSVIQVRVRGSSFSRAAIASTCALCCCFILRFRSKEAMLLVERPPERCGEEVEELFRFAGVQRERGMQNEFVEGWHWPEEEGMRGSEHRVIGNLLRDARRSTEYVISLLCATAQFGVDQDDQRRSRKRPQEVVTCPGGALGELFGRRRESCAHLPKTSPESSRSSRSYSAAEKEINSGENWIPRSPCPNSPIPHQSSVCNASQL